METLRVWVAYLYTSSFFSILLLLHESVKATHSLQPIPYVLTGSCHAGLASLRGQRLFACLLLCPLLVSLSWAGMLDPSHYFHLFCHLLLAGCESSHQPLLKLSSPLSLHFLVTFDWVLHNSLISHLQYQPLTLISIPFSILLQSPSVAIRDKFIFYHFWWRWLCVCVCVFPPLVVSLATHLHGDLNRRLN